MTHATDILGRPPVTRPVPKPEPDQETDWKGESHISNVKPDDWRNTYERNTRSTNTDETQDQRKAGGRAPKVKRICTHPDCNKLLSIRNRHGVCRNHNHLEGCGCVKCAKVREVRA